MITELLSNHPVFSGVLRRYVVVARVSTVRAVIERSMHNELNSPIRGTGRGTDSKHVDNSGTGVVNER